MVEFTGAVLYLLSVDIVSSLLTVYLLARIQIFISSSKNIQLSPKIETWFSFLACIKQGGRL